MSIQSIKDIAGNARILRISNKNEGAGLVDLNKIRRQQKAKLFSSNEPDTFPNEPPNESEGTDPKEGLYEAIENSKIKRPQDLLLQPGEKPVKNQKSINKNKKLAKISALIQLLDGIAGAVNLQLKQEEAVVAPQNLVPGAFEAVNNIRAINQKFDLDLRNYNRRQEDIEAKNKAILQQANAHNANVDVKLAQAKKDDARYENELKKRDARYEDELKKRNARYEQEEENRDVDRYYQIGLRLISNNETEAGVKYLQMAGLADEKIYELINTTNLNNGRLKTKNPNNGTFTERDKIAIRKYYNLQEQLNDIRLPPYQREAISDEMKYIRKFLGDKMYAHEYEGRDDLDKDLGSMKDEEILLRDILNKDQVKHPDELTPKQIQKMITPDSEQNSATVDNLDVKHLFYND